MNRRLVTILLCAFLVAAICAALVNRMIGARIQAASRPATTHVVAANSDIQLGTILTASNLTTVEIAGAVPKGAILKPEQAIGRGAIANLYQGEPVLESRLAPVGAGGGLAATIRPGFRACAVRVDEVVGVAGFVTAGQRVDVLISGTPPGQSPVNEGSRVRTLLQNIEVLSAGTDIQKDAEGKPKSVQVVNLLVAPDQAESLSLASSQMHIQLVLRNPLDSNIAKTTGTDVSNLFDDGSPKPKATPVRAAPRAPAPYSVEVINGSKRTDAKFAPVETLK